jgi:hypothetical protein
VADIRFATMNCSERELFAVPLETSCPGHHLAAGTPVIVTVFALGPILADSLARQPCASSIAYAIKTTTSDIPNEAIHFMDLPSPRIQVHSEGACKARTVSDVNEPTRARVRPSLRC